jgi:uncharacterized protein with HEPN domain
MTGVRDLLEHIRECVDAIDGYTAGLKHPLDVPVIRDAVLRNLQLAAQSALRLPPDMQAKHPEVSWRSLRGFRNVLVHDYLQLDVNDVQRALTESLPILRAAALTELAALPPEDSHEATGK